MLRVEYCFVKAQARVQLCNDLCIPALELSQEGCLIKTYNIVLCILVETL